MKTNSVGEMRTSIYSICLRLVSDRYEKCAWKFKYLKFNLQ